ncbi:MAG TPA: CBS domain-containing protein [Jatrophihabitantaceae bacterium]
MKISDILRHKGSSVVTIAPPESVRDLLGRLAEHNVGALVVAEGDEVVGIISERDIVRRLNERGADILDLPVSELMTASVVSCSPDDDVDAIAGSMTELRIRHMPVLNGDKLAGIVTIGDVVAGRIRQLEQDRGQLEQYITQGR